MEINFVDSQIINDMLTPELYGTKFTLNMKKVLNSGLVVKNLSDLVAEIYRGATPEHTEKCNNTYFLFKTVNIRRNELDLTNFFTITEAVYQENKRYHLDCNDALITIMGATDDIIGRCWAITTGYKAIFSDGLAVLKSINGINREFLTTFLNSKIGHNLILQWSSGSTRKYITNERLANIKIPLPSDKIQQYIGSKIRKAEELREEARKLVVVAESIFTSVVKDEKIYNNNAGNPTICFNQKPVYSSVDFKDINERLDAQSFHPECFNTISKIMSFGLQNIQLTKALDFYDTGISSPKYADAGVPIIMTKHIKNSYLAQINNYIESDSLLESKILATEDVLFTTYGGPSIGKVDIFVGPDSSTFDYTILRMRFKKEFNPYFMTLLLRSKHVQNQVRYMIKGTTGITFVNPKDILNTIIPVFPIGIQNEIGSKIKLSQQNMLKSRKFISEAKKDVEDLIEGKFESKISEGV